MTTGISTWDWAQGLANNLLKERALALGSVATKAAPPATTTSINAPQDPTPATAAAYSPDPVIRQQLRASSFVYGFQQASTSTSTAPRFVTPGVHVYETVEVVHCEAVSYWVGLKGIKAYRQDFTQDDNTAQYNELFHDQVNISNNTFSFQPNLLNMQAGQSTAQVTSTIFSSSRQVVGLQFASTQSEPVQLLPNQDLSDSSQWLAEGDPTLQFILSDSSVVSNSIQVTRGSYYVGGVTSVPFTTSGGRLHAAARAYAAETLSAPLILQVLDSAGHVIAENSVKLSTGQRAEWTVSVTPLAGYGPFTAQVVQTLPTNDVFSLEALSVFEDGILWEFSVDGGSTFHAAYDINSNPQGVIMFDAPGTKLMWRATALQRGQYLSALSIRPWYAGLLSGIVPHTGLTPGGPNINLSDHYSPIELDAHWQQWSNPVPHSWFISGKLLLNQLSSDDLNAISDLLDSLVVTSHPGGKAGFQIRGSEVSSDGNGIFSISGSQVTSVGNGVYSVQS